MTIVLYYCKPNSNTNNNCYNNTTNDLSSLCVLHHVSLLFCVISVHGCFADKTIYIVYIILFWNSICGCIVLKALEMSVKGIRAEFLDVSSCFGPR